MQKHILYCQHDFWSREQVNEPPNQSCLSDISGEAFTAVGAFVPETLSQEVLEQIQPSKKLDNVQLCETQEIKWRCLRCGTTTNKQKSATLKKLLSIINLFSELFTIMFRAGWRLSHGCRFT